MTFCFTDMWGVKRCSDIIHTRRDCPDREYANLSVWKDMWSLDFMYNYLFEYYFGQTKIGRKTIDMSVIQVADDGFYRSMANNPSPTDISTFLPADESNSYLIFTAGWNAWLRDEDEENYEAFIHKFLVQSKDFCVYKNEKGHWSITKRYPMQRFASQKEADQVISDFGKLVKDYADINLFNK